MRAKIAGWLVVPKQQANPAHQKPGIATANHDATNISAANMVKMPKIRQLMPGSGAQSPVSGKGHPKIQFWVHPVWTAYSLANAKFMAPQKCQPPIPTENAGSSNKPARQAPKMEKGGGSQSDDGDEEPRSPNTGGQKKFPPQIQTVNVVNTTQIPNSDRICTLGMPT